jgi:CelD/BcsL family acetyltransferase involved in cellulose biosynthesis
LKFSVEIVTEPERFIALRAAWQRVWIDSGGYIFQSHDWITGWLVGVQNRKDFRLRIALAWDGDRLAGVMPCSVHRRKRFRILQFAAQIFSDSCDCLIDPEYDRAVLLPVLWDGLMRAGGFDLVSLQHIRADACCRPFFDMSTSAGGAWRLEPQARCLRIDNHWPNGAVFFRSLGKKGRNNHTRGKRILTELGGEVRFRVIEPDEAADSVINEILRLKEVWLRANDPQSGLFGPDGIVLRAILDHAWRSGLAKIFVLQCGDKIAAASINFIYGGRMEAYLTTYDAAFERASPGTILIVEYAQWSFDRQLKLVDFLRGEEAFKFRLANAETLLTTVKGARTLVGHAAISAHRWLTRLRQRQLVVEAKWIVILKRLVRAYGRLSRPTRIEAPSPSRGTPRPSQRAASRPMAGHQKENRV